MSDMSVLPARRLFNVDEYEQMFALGILTFREPTDEGYEVTGIVRRAEELRPVAFQDIVLRAEDLLG